ncbi:Hypothetical protein LEPBI_I0429 [Leptospira biflexa serovar Patoc strain 'Patoc 1 (Paris)']|uniref:Uncharacterized protein n=1 Tax=Leptospira biflexa serovar Patoc (strain Patoc 1 / ATCC 23582 / Paris) TaxID=456481 RepID=B0SK15_LEPBP|nr:Hypothetical protein LEPBI_I0429 [Leptospira biflexa serovar Patoc strain 'Patoc 1 (Paris)']
MYRHTIKLSVYERFRTDSKITSISFAEKSDSRKALNLVLRFSLPVT